MELVCIKQYLELSTALTQRDIVVTGQLQVRLSGTEVSGTCSHQTYQDKSSNLKVHLKSETMKETRIETLVSLQQPLLAVSCSQLPRYSALVFMMNSSLSRRAGLCVHAVSSVTEKRSCAKEV